MTVRPKTLRLICIAAGIFIISAVLSVAFSYAVWQLNKGSIVGELKAKIETRLSGMLRRPVTIGALEYRPFQTLSARDVNVYSFTNTGEKVVSIEKVTGKVRLLSALLQKRLVATVAFEGLQVKSILDDVSGKVYVRSAKASSYRGVLNPWLVEDVTLMTGKGSLGNVGKFGDDVGETISASVKIDDGTIREAHARFVYNEMPYEVDLAELSRLETSYTVSARSGEIDLNGTLLLAGQNILLEGLSGVFYKAHLSIWGKVENYLSLQNIAVTLNSAVNGRIEDMVFLRYEKDILDRLPGSLQRFALAASCLGKFVEELDVSGDVDGFAYLKGKGTKPSGYDVMAKIKSDSMKIGKIEAKNVKGLVYVTANVLDASEVTGELYGGVFTTDVKVKPLDPAVPYTVKMKIEGVNMGRLASAVYGIGEADYGTGEARISIKGNATDWASVTGDIYVGVKGGDIGAVPFLKPLAGTEAPGGVLKAGGAVKITSATGQFFVKEGMMKTTDLAFTSASGMITSSGHMGSDGKLLFEFLKGMPGKDVSVEGAYTTGEEPGPGKAQSSGAAVTRLRVSGTQDKPEWAYWDGTEFVEIK